jgi:hypothetical protein
MAIFSLKKRCQKYIQKLDEFFLRFLEWMFTMSFLFFERTFETPLFFSQNE